MVVQVKQFILPSQYKFFASTVSAYNVSLINMVDSTDTEVDKEGLLVLKYIDEYGDTKNGSVCANNFDWWKANLFCRYLGYRTGKWGSYFGNFKHVSK